MIHWQIILSWLKIIIKRKAKFALANYKIFMQCACIMNVHNHLYNIIDEVTKKLFDLHKSEPLYHMIHVNKSKKKKTWNNENIKTERGYIPWLMLWLNDNVKIKNAKKKKDMKMREILEKWKNKWENDISVEGEEEEVIRGEKMSLSLLCTTTFQFFIYILLFLSCIIDI